MPTHDANIAELPPEQAPAVTTDWSDWERWLRGHLDHELKTLHAALGALLASERRKFETRARELEFTVAKLTGAVDVLRGAAPPPPAKFPSVKAWSADTICHEGEVVSFGGGCYQAMKDTARVPGAQDWVCLATPGNSLTVRGTYNSNVEYRCMDVVAMNGSSFVALKDAPGRCPTSGDWQLLASHGSRGRRGPSGQRGVMGLKGERGEAAPSIRDWQIDRARYVATPIMSDGTQGAPLDLRPLFEQFLLETQ